MNLFEYLTSNLMSIVYIKDANGTVLFQHTKYNVGDLPNTEQTIIIDGISYETTKVEYDNKTLYFTSSHMLNYFEYEQQFMEISNRLDIGIALIKDDQVIFRNTKLMNTLQLPPEQLGHTPWKLLQPQYGKIVLQLLRGKRTQGEVFIDINKDNPLWTLMSCSHNIVGNHHYRILTIKDITSIKQKEELYNQQQQYLSQIFENISEGIIVTDDRFKVTMMNQQAKKLLKEDHCIGRSVYEFFRLYDDNGYPVQYLPPDTFKSNDLEVETSDGQYFYVNVRITTIKDGLEVKGKVISFFEITEEKKREQEVLYLTYHDVLTGLHNRTFFEEQLKILDTKRKLPMSIILGDVNGLKLTNDVFGHQTGDLLLKQVARVLKSTCRHEDILSRWGGDEFIILLPNTTESQVHIIMNRIMVEMYTMQSRTSNVHTILPSLSLGYGVKKTIEEDVYSIIKIAENNMYKRKMLTNSSIYSSIISSMTNALYERSSETEEHANRLYQNCYIIAKEFDLPDAKLDDLELFAKLHDIGKIGIPDEILNKPSSLTKDEWDMMKKHPEIGFRIASSTTELKGVAKYILSHHEHYDGSGYPKNLKGSEIPLLSRILSVVDAYDAMTHDRPYRSALSEEQALLEIEQNAGTQFDPAVVSIFLRLHKQSKNTTN